MKSEKMREGISYETVKCIAVINQAQFHKYVLGSGGIASGFHNQSLWMQVYCHLTPPPARTQG
jgi:hypothetical protein